LPAFVLAQKWQTSNPGGEIVYLSSGKSIDKQISNSLEIEFKKRPLRLINFPAKKLWQYPKFTTQLFLTFFKSLFYLTRQRPQLVLSTGGYIAIPVCIAAKILKIPIDVYELNVIPGRATKLLASFCSKIFVTFQKCNDYFESKKKIKKKCFLSPYPVRYSEKDKLVDMQKNITFINQLLRSRQKTFLIKEAEKLGCEGLEGEPFYSFDLNKKTIFVLGGSQGSLYINSLFKDWILAQKSLASKIQVIHQIGSADQNKWKNFYRSLEIPSFIFSYYDNLKNFYLISDLVISRAGAGTLFELEFFNKKSIIIPLQTRQTDHQVFNAQEMARRNGDLFVVQKQQVSPQNLPLFSQNISNILNL